MPKVKVLVADDSPTYLAVVRDFLEKNGFGVVAARDGLDAVEAAYRESPDVVLVDVEMPRMNGYQVCRLLKLDPRMSRTQVVMLTSKDQPSDKYWGFQTGADSYVSKDQPLQVVLETLASLLERSQGCVAAVDSSKPTPYPASTDSTVDLLSRLNHILDRKLYEATILGEMSKLAWSARGLERTTQEMMALFEKLFDFDLAGMLMCRDRAGPVELVWMIRRSLSAAALQAAEERVLATCAERCGAVIDRRGIRRWTALAPGAAVGDNEDSPAVSPSYHLVPLGSRDHEVGLFVVWAGRNTLASAESLEIIARLANAAVVVLDNARLYQEMQRLATTDELTGLANYRQFQETLEREFQRSLRSGEPLGLLMLDLDNFKAINDTFGHKAGDQVLQAVGAAFAGNARPYDLLARYGGEEFAVILPSTSGQDAMEVAERLRLLVRTTAQRMNMDQLSASIGVAVYSHGLTADAQTLVREADAALYRAKAQGKNRVFLMSGVR